MASLIEELVSTLKTEASAYKELLPIAEKKTEIIIKNDLEQLQEVTEQEQLIVERINSLEHKREETVRNIATVINKKPKDLSLASLVRLMAKQPKEQKELSEVHDELKSAVNRLVVVNNRNKALIAQSLEMIEFNMNLIQSTRMSPGISQYTNRAAETDMQVGRTGMFDARQ